MIRIALFLLCLLILFKYHEGFDPFLPETRPDEYPDQSYSGELLLAEKYIRNQIKDPTNTYNKKHLNELLNLLQFI